MVDERPTQGNYLISLSAVRSQPCPEGIMELTTAKEMGSLCKEASFQRPTVSPGIVISQLTGGWEMTIPA